MWKGEDACGGSARAWRGEESGVREAAWLALRDSAHSEKKGAKQKCGPRSLLQAVPCFTGIEVRASKGFAF